MRSQLQGALSASPSHGLSPCSLPRGDRGSRDKWPQMQWPSPGGGRKLGCKELWSETPLIWIHQLLLEGQLLSLHHTPLNPTCVKWAWSHLSYRTVGRREENKETFQCLTHRRETGCTDSSLPSSTRTGLPPVSPVEISISVDHEIPLFTMACLEGRLCLPESRGLICLLQNQGSPSWSQVQPVWPAGTVPCPPLSPLEAVTLPSRLCRKSFSAVTLDRKREHKVLAWYPHRFPPCGFRGSRKLPSPSTHLRWTGSLPVSAQSVPAIKKHISLFHKAIWLWNLENTYATK